MFYSVCKNKQLFRELQIVSHNFDKLTFTTRKIHYYALSSIIVSKSLTDSFRLMPPMRQPSEVVSQ